MDKFTIIVTCSFGIESVTASELKRMGYENLQVENGKVMFKGGFEDVARCNVLLRTGDRVLIELANFKAVDFGQLFDRTCQVKWEDFIQPDGKMHVIGKSVKSRLHSVPDCQSIVKKAVIEAMKRRYKNRTFEENGPVYKIQVAILKDIVSLTVDTSGDGLHKRGYRVEAGMAPLKETLAAAMVLLSRWRPHRIFADPCCGSGTIAIEAALIGKNMAPGINRHFASEEWNCFDPAIWKQIREEARAGVWEHEELKILASDQDYHVLKVARQNAENAGVADFISFQKAELCDFRNRKKYGCIVTNPPYGERTGDLERVEALYEDMGEVYRSLDEWSFFCITSHPDFQTFFRKRATKNRKLYNGALKCYFYQYFGALPPRRKPGTGDDEGIQQH